VFIPFRLQDRGIILFECGPSVRRMNINNSQIQNRKKVMEDRLLTESAFSTVWLDIQETFTQWHSQEQRCW